MRDNVASTLQRAQTAQEDAALFGDLGSIRSQSETAQEVDRLRDDYQDYVQDSNITDFRRNALLEFGVTPAAIQELADIELQLADRATASGVTQERIRGAAGQTQAQAQREITQEQREEAVRSAGLAARAAVLQGNINTGRQLANDAVNIALQDRQFQANARLQQINDLKDVVDEETRQLLVAEGREAQAELANIQELKTNISAAITAGAEQSEIATMNDPNVPDAEKLALAQSVIGREAGIDRELERESLRASASASNALASQRYTSSLIDRAEAGDPAAIEELGYDPRQTSADVIVPKQYTATVDQAASLAGAEDQRETTKAIIGNALSEENYAQAYAQIANNVEESLTGTVGSRFANARTDINVMTGLRDAIEDYVAAGGDTGLLKGTAEDVAEKFGVLANSKDPEFAALGAQLQREFQTYRNIMTGAAFTPAESAEYEAVNPTENKSLDLNLAIIDGAVDQLENRVINTIETRVTGSKDIYERAITGGEEVEASSWEEMETAPIGTRFTSGGTLYEKAGEDNYIEIK